MPTYLPSPQRTRPIALCLSAAPVCPKCGRVFMDTELTADGRVMRFCNRKRQGRPCGGRAYIVGLDGELCVVIGISEAEWREITSRRAVQAVRDLGALVEAVTAANRTDV